MSKFPAPFWAVILAGMGCMITLCALFSHREVNVILAVLGVGSNLVSGALGAFAGHAQAASQTDVTALSAGVSINPK